MSRGRRRRTVATRAVALGVLAVAVVWPGRALLERGEESAGQLPLPVGSALALDAELVARFEVAQAAAAREGVDLRITSGWRSAAQQQQIVEDVVAERGWEEAQRIALPPEVSAHVTGAAIDVGPLEGALWLEGRAETFGLCRTYDNEWWHFELIGEIGEPCPQRWPDASHGWEVG